MSKMFSISEYLLYLVYLAYKNCVLKAFHHRRVLTIWYVCKYFMFTSVMPEIVYLGTVTTRRWRPHSALLHSQVGERLHTYTLCTLHTTQFLDNFTTRHARRSFMKVSTLFINWVTMEIVQIRAIQIRSIRIQIPGHKTVFCIFPNFHSCSSCSSFFE